MTSRAEPAIGRAQCSDTVRIGTSADAVWAVVGDLASLVPGGGMVERVEVEGKRVGAVRTFHLPGGARVVERIESHDPSLRRYTYRIIDSGPLPLTDYLGTAAVAAEGPTTCLLTWSADFASASEDGGALRALVEANLSRALQAVAAHFRTSA